MGQIDIITKEYMGDNEVFADAFNYCIFKGRQVISPDSLHAEDTSETAVIYLEQGDPETGQRYRDLLKSAVLKTDGGVSYLLLGIENQNEIHCAMPVRNAIYDALQYGRQVRETAQRHRQNGDWTEKTRGEFLSGFYKEDRLRPVVTLVVSFSPDRWDAPLSLHEMMEDCDPQIMEYVQDYRVHLIEPAAISEEDRAKFATELGDVLNFIKYSGDKDKMEELLRTDPAYHWIRTSAAQVLNACTDIGLRIGAESEVTQMTDMTKAWRELREGYKAEGIAIGEARGEARGEAKGREIGTIDTLTHSVKALMESMNWTADQAMTALQISDADRETLTPLL